MKKKTWSPYEKSFFCFQGIFHRKKKTPAISAFEAFHIPNNRNSSTKSQPTWKRGKRCRWRKGDVWVPYSSCDVLTMWSLSDLLMWGGGGKWLDRIEFLVGKQRVEAGDRRDMCLSKKKNIFAGYPGVKFLGGEGVILDLWCLVILYCLPCDSASINHHWGNILDMCSNHETYANLSFGMMVNYQRVVFKMLTMKKGSPVSPFIALFFTHQKTGETPIFQRFHHWFRTVLNIEVGTWLWKHHFALWHGWWQAASCEDSLVLGFPLGKATCLYWFCLQL